MLLEQGDPRYALATSTGDDAMSLRDNSGRILVGRHRIVRVIGIVQALRDAYSVVEITVYEE
jgi:hypothetical protein